MKLHNYDLVVMGNKSFKFQLDWLSQKAWDAEAARVSFVSLLNSADQVIKPVFWPQPLKKAGYGFMQSLFPL